MTAENWTGIGIGVILASIVYFAIKIYFDRKGRRDNDRGPGPGGSPGGGNQPPPKK